MFIISGIDLLFSLSKSWLPAELSIFIVQQIFVVSGIVLLSSG